MNEYTNQISPIGEDAVEPCLDGWEHCSRPVVSIFKGQDPSKVCDQVVLWNFLRVPINWVPAEHVVVEESNNCQAKNGGGCDGCNKYGLCGFTEDPSTVIGYTLEEAMAKINDLMDDSDPCHGCPGPDEVECDNGLICLGDGSDDDDNDSAAWDLIRSHTSVAASHRSDARYKWDNASKQCEFRYRQDNDPAECLRNQDSPVSCLYSYCPRAHGDDS